MESVVSSSVDQLVNFGTAQPQAASRMHILDLPDDALILIAERLDLVSIVSFSKMNQRLEGCCRTALATLGLGLIGSETKKSEHTYYQPPTKKCSAMKRKKSGQRTHRNR
ncbi:uncharacterized protein LOC100905135 [Galendromus occidentalis]|uniref:Uncharacterized protein LOC100905135 n=1 Tax=Galendromus occidentalis TaxID=34638 RepID=A0AAJ6VXQ9_9ACAR|nr:uncharacterized protein LOC100905135 [Galendromus occidentalis]